MSEEKNIKSQASTQIMVRVGSGRGPVDYDNPVIGNIKSRSLHIRLRLTRRQRARNPCASSLWQNCGYWHHNRVDYPR